MKKKQKTEMLKIQHSLFSELPKLPLLGYDSLNQKLLSIITQKLQRPSVRSSFTYWLYQYIKQCSLKEKKKLKHLSDDLLELKLPLIIEMVVAAIFLHNQILDKKNKITHPKAMAENAALHSMLKDLVYEYVDDCFGRESSRINKEIRRLFRCVDTGQTLAKECDLAWLINPNAKTPVMDARLNAMMLFETIEPVKQDLIKNMSDFDWAIEYYFKRNYLISSSLFRIVAELIIYISGYVGKEKKKILQFADNYGLMMQLVSDINDFVFERGTKNKEKGDVLSDLKNGTLTLPLLLHFDKNRTRGLIEVFLQTQDQNILAEKHNEVLKEMILSRALVRGQKVGREIAEKSKPLISGNSQYSIYLINLLDIAYKNRYYHHIFLARKFYKKPANRNKIYRCEDHLSSFEDAES